MQHTLTRPIPQGLTGSLLITAIEVEGVALTDSRQERL
jgi:hypothetical protein